ncbi:MAG: ABC transporter permease [Hyphomicrobiaceae bacterium]
MTAAGVGRGLGHAAEMRRLPVLQRLPWLAGYLLMSPTIVVVLAMLIAPLVALLVISFWTQAGFEFDKTWTIARYVSLFAPGDGITWMGIPFPLANPVYAILMVKSLFMSLFTTISVVLFAYPMAYFLAFRVTRYKILWLILITVPFWTSYLLRVFSWKIILGFNGAINSALMSIGIIDQPLEFLVYNMWAVVITLTHAWAAFAILPIYVSLDKIDRSLLEAATDLGDRPWQRFLRVTLPLSMPGTISAALLVFIPTVGDYVTPTLVGGTGGSMIGNAIQNLFGKQNDWPLGAAVSVTMMVIVAIVVLTFLWLVGYREMQRKRGA